MNEFFFIFQDLKYFLCYDLTKQQQLLKQLYLELYLQAYGHWDWP